MVLGGVSVVLGGVSVGLLDVDDVDCGGGCDSGLEVSVITAVVVSAGVVL